MRREVWIERLRFAGETLFVLSYPLASRLALAPLTPAERDVVRRVLLGGSNAEIAAARGCAASTVAKHLTAAYAKLRVRSRAELACTVHGGSDRVRRRPR